MTERLHFHFSVSCIGEGNGNPLQCSCLENPRDGEAWWAADYWKRLGCWEGLGAGGEGDDRGWDGWMASLTRWTWVWVNSGTWWWTGRPGVLQFMGSQRVWYDWATELNWTELKWLSSSSSVLFWILGVCWSYRSVLPVSDSAFSLSAEQFVVVEHLPFQVPR